MKAMTTLESIRLYLSALWHTIIWPKTTLGQAVVGYIIFYFVLLWEAQTFAEGIAFGAWSILVIQACHSWAKRPSNGGTHTVGTGSGSRSRAIVA